MTFTPCHCHEKFVIPQQKKVKPSSSSSFSGFSSPVVMPLPLSGIFSRSFDNADATTNASLSDLCTTLPVTVVKPIVSHKPVSDSSVEPSWKRKREHSGSLSTSFIHDKKCPEFQQIMASYYAAKHSLSLSLSQSPRSHRSCSFHLPNRLPLLCPSGHHCITLTNIIQGPLHLTV